MAEIKDHTAATELGPNIYKAVVNTKFNTEADARQAEQMFRTYKKAKELLKLSSAEARKEFLKLDPIVKSNIRFIYPDKAEFQPEQNLIGKITQAAGKAATDVFNALASPLMAGFNIADKSAKTTATPYNVYAQLRQGADFTKKLITDAFDGKNSWNWDSVALYEEKHGKAAITLARALSENRTIGEAIDLYGTVDADMLNAIKFANDEPDKWKNIMSNLQDDAQVSPGRDISNSIIKPNAKINQQYWAYKFNKLMGVDIATPAGQKFIKKSISGPVDAIYRILTDPFTYAGVGPAIKISKQGLAGFKVGIGEAYSKFGGLQTKGERLAAQYQFIAERGGTDKAFSWVFSQPEVKTLWDKELGPRISKFVEAKTNTEKATVLRSIKFDFPDWYNTEVIRKFADYKVFDAKSAEYFFSKIDDMNTMFNGTVDGIMYRRNGIPYARKSRLITSAVHKVAYNIFNRTGSVATEQAILKSEKELADALGTLSNVAMQDNKLINVGVENIADITKDINTAKKLAYKLGEKASRSPGQIIWGPDAVKTAESIRVTAVLAGLPRDMAEAITLAIVDEPQDIQLTVVRNMQYAFMKRIGMKDEDAKALLVKTYNESAGFYSVPETPIPEAFTSLIHPAVYEIHNGIPYLVARGGIHPSQLTKGIAPLPFDEIYQQATGLDKIADKNTKAKNFMLAFGGATRNNFAKTWNDLWGTFTLFPRLGTRTNVDEGFFHFLVNQPNQIGGFIAAKADKAYKAATGLTGSSSGIGMWKGGFYAIANKLGIKDSAGNALDPRKLLPPEERRRIVAEVQNALREKYEYDIPLSEISHSEIREALLSRMEEFYPTIKGTETWDNMKRVMRYHPNFTSGTINSIGAKNVISGKIDEEFFDSTFSVDGFRMFLKEHDLKLGRDYEAKYIDKMSNKEVAVTMWDNFNIRFGVNEVKIVKGRYVSPVTTFFENNALRTEKDIVQAQSDVLDQMAVFLDKKTGTVFSENEDITRKAIEQWGQSVYLRQQGYSDAEIAKIIVDTMLMDMRFAFHGSTSAFNQKLYDLVKSKHEAIIQDIIKNKKSAIGFEGAWKRATGNLTWDEFNTATIGFRPVSGRINTRVISNGKIEDLENLKEGSGFWFQLEKFQGNLMDIMDRQVTGFFRTPAFTAAINKGFKDIVPYEKTLAERFYQLDLKQNPTMDKAILRARANLLAEKHTTEIVVKQAQDAILEFVDNPNIRSNFAVSIRHLGRFFRATEDFQRRMYRMYTKKGIRTLYKLRLLHLGLEANGSVYQDEKGDEYIVFPTDTIINSVIEPIVRGLTGRDDSYQIPTFNDLTLKFRLINPSFSPDAGQPAFAGPLAALPMLALKSFLRDLPFVPGIIKDKLYPYTNNMADFIDQYGLGHIGKNTDLNEAYKLAFPMLGTSIIDTLGSTEFSRQKSSGVMQAMSYLQAFGNGLPANATEEEKRNYLKNIKIAVSSWIAGQTILGQISPGYPTLKDSAALPDYFKNVGLSTMKSEFWDIYNGILRNAGDDVTDPLNLALATFIGKNPGKLVYLVPRNTKAMKVFINKTNNLKNWAIDNRQFVDTYKEIAYIFAPKVGEYNPDIYNWMEAENLVSSIDLEKYLEAIQIEQDKQIYFAIGDQEKLDLSNTADYNERKKIIANASAQRQQLIWANPMLGSKLNSGESRDDYRLKLKTLSEAVNDDKSPIPSNIKAIMRTAIQNVNSFVDYTRNSAAKNYPDYADSKSNQKANLIALLTELSNMNPEVKEANRLIFTPLIRAVAPDTVSAGG